VGEDSPDRLTIDFAKDWFVAVRLERIPVWIFDAKAPVECTPLGLGKYLYIGTRAGKIHCLDSSSGSERWTYTIPNGMDVAAGLRAFQDRICFGTFDGTFHVLQAESGRLIHQVIPLTPPRPIREPSSEPTREGMVAINCGGVSIAGVNVANGAAVWTQRADSEIIGPPQLDGGRFVVPTAEGVILVLDPASGGILRRVPLGIPLQVPGAAVNGAYIASDAAGRIRRIDLQTAAVKWTYQSPMEEFTPAVLGGNLVFFGSRGGLFAALDAQSGDLKWRGKVNEGIGSPAVWHRGNFYLCTKGGQRLCLEGTTGVALWNFGGGGSCRAAPSSAGHLVIFPDGDHRVFAFPED